MNTHPLGGAVQVGLADLTDTPAATQGVLRLFEAVFGHPMPAATWHWKYRCAPQGCALNLMAFDTADRHDPCGHVGCLILPGHWRGKPVRMAQLTDVMVHPRARGGMEASSVYSRLMHEMANRLRALDTAQTPVFAYGFPGRTPSRLGQRMGLYQPLRIDECQPVWAHDARAALPTRRATVWPSPSVVHLADTGQDLPHGSAFDRCAQHLVTRAPQPLLHKGADYIRWRYLQHPQRQYRLWGVRRPWGSLLGWIVTSQASGAWIVDAHLPLAWSEGQGWDRLVQSLCEATGEARWHSWRRGAGAGTPGQPSLIVPGEFRFSALTAVGGAASHAAAARRPSAAPNFHPGDTDVF